MGNSYDLEIDSYSKGGHTINPLMDFKFTPKDSSETLYIWISGILATLAIIILLSIWIGLAIVSSQIQAEKFAIDLELAPLNDSMEIHPVDVEVNSEKPIGTGAYGCVYRGKLFDVNVAVKMIQNSNDDTDKAKRWNLYNEIKLMKSVGHHVNI